jgi:hypothetical protein
MMSQENLARSFENGATSGRASSVEIREIEGGYALVDTRGKAAVLAFRYPSGHFESSDSEDSLSRHSATGGEVVAFEGWYGHSVSTSTMMTKMGLSVTCRHDDDRLYRANATAAEAPTLKSSTLRGWGSTADCLLGDWLDEHDPTHIGEAVTKD